MVATGHVTPNMEDTRRTSHCPEVSGGVSRTGSGVPMGGRFESHVKKNFQPSGLVPNETALMDGCPASHLLQMVRSCGNDTAAKTGHGKQGADSSLSLL